MTDRRHSPVRTGPDTADRERVTPRERAAARLGGAPALADATAAGRHHALAEAAREAVKAIAAARLAVLNGAPGAGARLGRARRRLTALRRRAVTSGRLTAS